MRAERYVVTRQSGRETMQVIGDEHVGQLVQRRLESGRLVDARGQHHAGALVEDYLVLQAQLADRVQDRGLVRRPGCQDRSTDRERLDATRTERLDERARRRIGERRRFATGWTVEQRPVLCYDVVEE